jgi:hypothetical protein
LKNPPKTPSKVSRLPKLNLTNQKYVEYSATFGNNASPKIASARKVMDIRVKSSRAKKRISFIPNIEDNDPLKGGKLHKNRTSQQGG